MGNVDTDKFNTSVKLSVKGVPAEIQSLEQFDTALGPKTQITTQLFAKLSALSDEKVTTLTLTTRKASDRLQQGLALAVDSPSYLKTLFLELGKTFFTEDHAWRELFSQLVALPAERNDVKLLALTQYRRYLLARLGSLNLVSCNRIESKICNQAHSATEEPTSLGEHPGITQELSSSETIVRDVVRLPKGKTAPLRSADQASLDIWLAKTRFRIEMWGGPSLIDNHGNTNVLKEGRNSVGRAICNDIIIDPGYAEVSRSHMIVDVAKGRPVGITDLSSGGTYLSRTLVAA